MTSLKTSTLRPGILVSLKTSITGNVSYDTVNLEAEHVTEGGEGRARWETTRTVADPAELEAAKKARGAATTRVRSVCRQSTFGLLCPEDRSPELAAVVEEARKLADEFNRTAAVTRLGVFVLCGRVAPDDVEAVRAIGGEVAELLLRMQDGVRNLDASSIREAASRARGLSDMLEAGASERLMDAVAVARAAARKIIRAGEQAAQEVDLHAVAAIARARTEFLDLGPAGEVAAPGEEGRALDLAPPDATAVEHAVVAPAAPQLEV